MNQETSIERIHFEVEDFLAQQGVNCTFDDLKNPDIYPDCAEILLELFKRPYPADMLWAISIPLFRRKMTRQQKEEAILTCIQICQEHIAKAGNHIEFLAANELADNAGPPHVEAIGKMFLDTSIGEKRAVLSRALGKIANENAISYLREGVKDPCLANWAIIELARLAPPAEVIKMCESALQLPDVRFKHNIGEMLAKAERRLKKRKPKHLTQDKPTAGLAEWSTNIDLSQLSKLLRQIRKIIDSGFGRQEAAEVRAVVDEMSSGEVKTLKFDVVIREKPHVIWIQFVCDDEDAFDFYFWASKDVIWRMDNQIQLG